MLFDVIGLNARARDGHVGRGIKALCSPGWSRSFKLKCNFEFEDRIKRETQDES